MLSFQGLFSIYLTGVDNDAVPSFIAVCIVVCELLLVAACDLVTVDVDADAPSPAVISFTFLSGIPIVALSKLLDDPSGIIDHFSPLRDNYLFLLQLCAG